MLTGWHTLDGEKYYFYASGKMAKNTTIDGIRLGADGAEITGNTIKGLLQNALKPVGSTLYITGGGHDDWNGGDAVRAGVNPNWKTYYNKQSSNFDFRDHRYEYENGLDCSGFVGWAVYNTFNTKSNQSSCTSTSTATPKWYSEKGWGSYSFTTSASFLPGDVVSKSGHVWIILGQCSDGSVVVIHATPQAGVQIAGSVNKKGSAGSEAVALAKSYMKKYYSSCVRKFNLSSITDITYLKGTRQSGINRFRWKVSTGSKMSDPEGIRGKTPAQILKILFGE